MIETVRDLWTREVMQTFYQCFSFSGTAESMPQCVHIFNSALTNVREYSENPPSAKVQRGLTDSKNLTTTILYVHPREK